MHVPFDVKAIKFSDMWVLIMRMPFTPSENRQATLKPFPIRPLQLLWPPRSTGEPPANEPERNQDDCNQYQCQCASGAE